MTRYTMSRTVHLEDPAELREWHRNGWPDADPDDYDQDAALELLLSDEYLTDMELAAMGVVSSGPVSVQREEP